MAAVRWRAPTRGPQLPAGGHAADGRWREGDGRACAVRFGPSVHDM
jgi:hypothetical protein